MRGAILYGPKDLRFEERETPTILLVSHRYGLRNLLNATIRPQVRATHR